MGGRSSRLSDGCLAFSSEVLEQVAVLPPPSYDQRLWLASCRPPRKLSVFAENMILFQPDCRMFCPEGPQCKLLRGTNETHRQSFLHVSTEVLRAAGALDLNSRSPSTLVVNGDGTETPVSLPFISQVWSLERRFATDATQLPDDLVGCTVILWVHGFKQRYFRVVSVAGHVLHRFRTHDVSDNCGNAPVVLAFMWPSHLKAASYGRARSAADQAGTHLVQLLLHLRRLKCRTILIGHSLGCRVSLRALTHTLAREETPALCDHLILLAAAVASDALSDSGEFPANKLAVSALTVLSSTNDDVLKTSFALGEFVNSWQSMRPRMTFPSALGMVGPASQLPSNCHWEDVSSTVASHNPNLWLLQNSVLRHITAAVQGSVLTAVDAVQEGRLEWPEANTQEEQEEEEEDDDIP